jgi:hypothetical protein
MSAVVVQVLILWAVLAAALGTLWLLKRLGVALAPLPYAGVFGFIGAAFGIVIGLTTFFASQHYASVRTAEQMEATQLATLVAMSGSFPARSGLFVQRETYCYVTDIIDREWPAMQRGDEQGSPQVDGRLQALYQELLRVGRMNPQPSTWYSNAVTAGIYVGQDRAKRLLLGARGQIPYALWGLIYFGAGLMAVFAVFFHMGSRRQLVWMTVAVVVMLSVLTGVIAGLDHPSQRPFGLSPNAMRVLQVRLADGLGLGGTDPLVFCRAVPTVPVP